MIFFQNPYILLLLFLPLGFLLLSFSKENDPLKNFIDKDIREKLLVVSKTFSSKTKYNLFLLVISLFIISLARPIKSLSSLDMIQNRSSIILAIDMSKSMEKKDIFPSRREFAISKARTFIKKSTNYDIAVVFYAKDTYMLYPLCKEKDLLFELLKDVNITQKFSPNSNLFSVLESSDFLLQNHKNRHIVLFSDGGEDILRDKELSFLISKDISLSNLATRSDKNKGLQKLCLKSSGIYQPFIYSNKDISSIIRHINLSKKSSQKIHHDISQVKEYFSFPLALSLIIMALLFLPLKRIFFFFLLYIQPVSLKASVFDFWYIHKAQKECELKNYSNVIKEYKHIKSTPQIYYNIGYALYKDSKYNESIKYYKKALGVDNKMNSKIYYNIATSYARENKLDFAKKFYEKSFALYHSNMTKENLYIVSKALKKQRKNLHKKYEKIHFKAIGRKNFENNNPSSAYNIKLQNLIPSEEDRWFKKVSDHNSPTYLKKIKTYKRSIDANISW